MKEQNEKNNGSIYTTIIQPKISETSIKSNIFPKPVNKTIKVAELFAGVGGFRFGLEQYDKGAFETVFFNQWEPATKKQSAYDCYLYHYGLENIREDLIKYTNSDIRQVPKKAVYHFIGHNTFSI